jgi:hypothetical protein
MKHQGLLIIDELNGKSCKAGCNIEERYVYLNEIEQSFARQKGINQSLKAWIYVMSFEPKAKMHDLHQTHDHF